MDSGEIWELLFVLVFSSLIVVLVMDLQFGAAVENVKYSSFRFADTLKAQSAAMHFMTHERSEGFGEFSRSDFEHVTRNCGKDAVKGVQDPVVFSPSRRTSVRLFTDGANCQTNPSTPVILGVEVTSGGDSRAILK
jgi:hypothetical protein